MRVGTGPITEKARWLIAWLLFSSLSCTWALASPIFSVPDEPAHAVYAAAAVRGEVWAPTTGFVTTVKVPAEYQVAGAIPTCYAFKSTVPAGCAPAYAARPGTAEVTTTAGRYPPAYYLYAGLGSLVASGAKAIYAMRILTALLVSAFLASAACSLLRLRRRMLPLAGLGLATTPMLYFFAGAVNPQAPEIAAAVALWASGAVLLLELRRDPTSRPSFSNPLLRRVLLSALALTMLRPLSLLWLAIIVGALLIALGTRAGIRRLLTAPAMLVSLPVIAASAIVSLVWIQLRHALEQQDITAYADVSTRRALAMSSEKLYGEYQHMIGYFGWLDAPPPAFVYVVYTALLGALVTLAARGMERRRLIAIGLTLLAVVIVPIASEVHTFRASGFAWQGRYTLPIAVGIPLLLGLGRQDTAEPRSIRGDRRTLLWFCAGLTVVQVGAFVGALGRYVHGIDGFWFASPAGWRPWLPTPLLVAGAVLSALLMTYAAVRSLRSATPDACDTERLIADRRDAEDVEEDFWGTPVTGQQAGPALPRELEASPVGTR